MNRLCILMSAAFAASSLQWASYVRAAAPAKEQLVTTFAGTGEKGFSGDGGPADKAQLNNPFAVARGPDGYLYICDVDNHRIRRVSKDGIITTFAGSAKRGYSGDGGPATDAALNMPYELAWDRSGNLYFVEIGSHVVRRVDAKTGVISTVAGTGKAGFGGDGGPANKAQLSQPHSLAFDSAGDLYVCDIINHRIRKIDIKSGSISTWSGTGQKKTSPDGSKIAEASLNGPRALAFAADGTVSGTGGCNRIAGSYTLAGETIGFGQMISSMMACEPLVSEQEARFLRALAAAKRWRITPAGRLELLGAEGAALARLARR